MSLPARPDFDHPQVFFHTHTGEPIHCDKEVAELIFKINFRVFPVAETRFSCQGDRNQKTTTGYVMLVSTDQQWIQEFAEKLKDAFDRIMPRPVLIYDRGEFDSKGFLPRRKSIRLEIDYMDADRIIAWLGPRAKFMLGPAMKSIHRLVVRWRPEDFNLVEQAFEHATTETCQSCFGAGASKHGRWCKRCEGEGRVIPKRRFAVKLPLANPHPTDSLYTGFSVSVKVEEAPKGNQVCTG